MSRERWLRHRTFAGTDFDPDELGARKRSQGARVSVALPARDVADTVGAIVEAVRAEWMGPRGLVDQIVVIDSGSRDSTWRTASEAGAEVVRAHEILPDLSPEPGKGEALWKSLAVVTGDLVVWLDADVAPFDPAFVPGLLGPLLHDPGIDYVKAFYRRDLHGRRDEGGRVTEICARPLINLFYPELAGFVQPLAGEAAGRSEILRHMPFFTGYAVEIGLLVDLWRHQGLAALAQVDLGRRHHRHQSTAALGGMGYEITRAVLDRLAEEGRAPASPPAARPYARPARRDGGLVLESDGGELVRRPPLISLAARAPERGKGPVPGRHSPATTDIQNPTGEHHDRRGNPLHPPGLPVRPDPDPDHPEGPPARVSHANGHRPGEAALRERPPRAWTRSAPRGRWPSCSTRSVSTRHARRCATRPAGSPPPTPSCSRPSPSRPRPSRTTAATTSW